MKCSAIIEYLFGWNEVPNAFANKESRYVASSSIAKVWKREMQDVTCSSAHKTENWLAKYRLVVAIIGTIYFGAQFSLQHKTYFDYLTNWGNLMGAFTYVMLAVAHYREGHFSKQKDPSQDTSESRRKHRCCSGYWKWTTFAF